jgi:hypothetical protein
MPGRVNHRGWIVLTSVASDYNPLCVDFFEDPVSGFGFEHFRADPEDGGRWTAVGGFGDLRFESMALAVHRAKTSVFWLEQEPRARASIDTLLTASEQHARDQDRGD